MTLFAKINRISFKLLRKQPNAWHITDSKLEEKILQRGVLPISRLRPELAGLAEDSATQFKRNHVYYYIAKMGCKDEIQAFLKFANNRVIIPLFLPKSIISNSESDHTYGHNTSRRYQGHISPYYIGNACELSSIEESS